MQALRKAFHFDKFEGTDFKYGYKFHTAQNYTEKTFLVPGLKNLCFAKNIA